MVDLVWTPWVIPGLVAWLLSWGAAVVIYRASPREIQNRLLALGLFFEGATVGAFFVVGRLTEHLAFTKAGIQAIEYVAQVPAGFIYLAFLGTIAAPLSRPLARPWVRRILVGTAFSWIVAWPLLSPYILAGNLTAVSTPTGTIWRRARGPLGDTAELFTLAVMFLGLAVAWSAYRAARPETAQRGKARAYLRAFGFRDGIWLGVFVLFYTFPVFGWPLWLVVASWELLAVAQAGFVLLLGYGILKTQLFDIDLKIKRTVKQGTVVTVLVGAYIVTSLGARAVMSPDAAQTTGVVLTGLLLFALVPLQRFGGRMADAAMPGVRDDETYLDQRRIEVYQAALEEALTPEGDLPVAREATLSHLRGRLGLTDRDHAVLLHAVRTPEHTAIAPTFEPGRQVLGRYRIEELLGEGGQGTTYRALDITLGREVVLKALHGEEPRTMLKEARALARIDHPNVVTIHDVERVGEHVYLIMEHVEGGSLKDRLEAGALEEAGFHDLTDHLLAGLQAIHDAGLIHRDVKPSNVLLTLNGQAKLADLGLATTAEPTDQTTLGAGSTSARGTIAYMSPEQARGDKLTASSDLFSAAATLYEAYTGRSLFEPRPGESAVELQARVASWSGFEEDMGDAEIEAWFARALAPVPRDRHERATAMRTVFERARPQAGGERVDAPPPANQGAD